MRSPSQGVAVRRTGTWRSAAALGLWLWAAGLAAPVPARAAERLPLDVVPLAQSIALQLDPARPDYAGSTRIAIEVRSETDAIEFHAEEMRITSCALFVERTGFELPVDSLPDGRVRARVPWRLHPGRYELRIEFENEYGTQGVGLYRMSEGARSYLFTQFEEVDAREAFPCWDEPSFKIPYTFAIAAPESETVVVNAPLASESSANGWRTALFETTPPLPTYLLTVAVGRFERIPIPGMSVPGDIYLLPGQRERAQLALEMTPPLLAELEHYFGERYPFAKCDFIAVPEFWAGAMEHPGAISFSARLYLLDPETAGVSQKRYLAWTIAHELAHIWFGDLVTLSWWDDLWLNESFADWLGVRVTDAVYPELRLLSEELSYNADVMNQDARPTSQAIRQPVEDTDELLQNIEVQYDKGRAVLGMFERWLGRERFRNGVLRYLADHRWGNATSSDLWAALHSVTDQDVPAAMRTFLEQPGLPLIRAELLPENRVRLTQGRFTAAGVEQTPLGWQIPVVLRYADDSGVREQSAFLTEPSRTIALSATGPVRWLHPNADQSGYYRWSVSDTLLRALLAAGDRELSERERVGLASNLWSLVEAGLLHGDVFLEAMSRLAASQDPLVVFSALEELPRARDPLVTEETESAFAAYVRRILAPAYARWGTEGAEPSLDAQSIRPHLYAWLGDHGRDPGVRARMTALADRYLEDPGGVNAEEAAVAFRVSAYDGDSERYRRYRAAFEAAGNPSDRVLFLRALGSFRRPALRDSALAYSLAGPLRATETFEIPRMVYRDPTARDRLLDWAITHYDTLARRVPPSFLTRVAEFGGGCSPERMARAQAALGTPARDMGGMGTALEKAAEQVAACRRLHEREEARVATYLREEELPR